MKSMSDHLRRIAKNRLMKSQLDMGIDVEREHRRTVKKIRGSVKDGEITMTDEEIYEAIARDHLRESPLYYTYLSEMEERFEK